MNDLENLKIKVETQLVDLLSERVKYKYIIEDGILKNRTIHQFIFDNIELKKKLVIVYCKENLLRIEGFLINYNDFTPNYLNFKHFISLNRLSVLLTPNDFIFYRSKQYQLSYKTEEIFKVVHKIKPFLITEKWIDFAELKKIEKEKTVLEYEYSRNRSIQWIHNLIKILSKEESIQVVYNPVEKPPYEEQNLHLINKFGDIFRIGYGHFSRYDSGYSVSIINKDKIVKSKVIYASSSMNKTLINYCKKCVKHDNQKP